MILVATLIPQPVLILLLVLAGSFLFWVGGRQRSIIILLGIYLACALFMAQLNQSVISLVTLFVGILVSLIFYLSGQQARWRQHLRRAQLRNLSFTREPSRIRSSQFFRLMVVLLLFMAAIALTQQYLLAPLAFGGTFVAYWLILVGFFLVMMNEGPLEVGQGLLLMLLGFEVGYVMWLLDIGLVRNLGIVQLLVALVVGYLVTHHHQPVEEIA